MTEEIINKQEIKGKDLEVETKESHKKNTEKNLKLVSIILGIFLIIAIVLIKLANKDMSWKFPIIFIIIITVIAILVFFSFEIARRLSKEKPLDISQKLPASVDLLTLRFIAEETLINEPFANHIKKVISEKQIYTGKDTKNKIYVLEVELLYKNPGEDGRTVILINSHDSKNTKSILFSPNSYELTRAINQLCSSPEDEKDVSEDLIFNPMTNTYVQHRKYEKPKDKKEDKTKKKEEDL